jgi:hypothetical protein
MNKGFIPYEQSLELKELGFDEECFGRYLTEEVWILALTPKSFKIIECQNSKCSEFDLAAPTFSQAFKWFREKCDLYQEIRTFAWDYDKKQLGFSVGTYLNPLQPETERKIHLEVYETYEEAELACLNKLIEIIKTK